MTTSPPTLSISDLVDEKCQIKQQYLAYFAARSQNDAHELVLSCYQELRDSGLTRRDIAARLNKKPEQVTRWLGSPGNWTLETLSNLLLALGHVPDFGSRPISSLNITSSTARDCEIINIKMISTNGDLRVGQESQVDIEVKITSRKDSRNAI